MKRSLAVLQLIERRVTAFQLQRAFPTRYNSLPTHNGSGCPHRCTYSSSTTSHYGNADDEFKHTAQDILNSQVGSMDTNNWSDAEAILGHLHLQTNETNIGNTVELSFQLLDRLAKEEEDVRSSHFSNFNPINSVIYHWRNHVISQNQQSQNPETPISKGLLPSQVLATVRGSWSSKWQPDTKTYSMILEAAASFTTQNHQEEGALLAESLLRWMIQQSYSHTQFSIRPTTVCFATVMKAWVASGHPGAVKKVQFWLHRLTNLHEEGWPDLQPNVVVYNILLHAMAQAGQVEQAEELLQSMMLQNNQQTNSIIPGVEADHISFTTLLSAYTKLQTPQGMVRAETLLAQMQELNEAGTESAKPNVISYTTVMEGYARMGKGAAAEALLQKLEVLYRETKDPDWKLDATAYNTVIMAWARANRIDRAEHWLRYMYEGDDDGVVPKPDERSFNGVLSACANIAAAEAPDKAESILNWMHDCYEDGDLESPPTVVTYNTVLDSWAKSNRKDACRRSHAILQHMEDLYVSGYGVVKPNARSWNIVLNSYAKAGQLFHAETLVEQFMHASKENRVDGKPNTRTWNSLLAACAKKNDVHKAKQFWRHMQECGIPPNIVSYNTLLSCYARSTVMKTQDVGKDIEAIFRQLQQEDSNVTPNRITYLALINAWIGGAGRPEKAESILKDICKNHAMNDAAIRPDRDLFHKVLAAWSDQKSPRRAESLFLMMVELHERHGYTDLKPTVETYNRLLNAWAKSMEREAGERADLILRQMEDFARAGDKDVCPDLITYNSVLNAWANSGDPIAVTRVERLVLEMILKGNPKLTPTIVSYGTWLKAIDTSNEDDKDRRAQEVLKTMKIHKLEPTDFIRRKVESLTKPTDNMEPTGKTVQ